MDTIHVTRAGGGEHWLFGADVTTIRASAAHTSDSLLVLEVTVAPGGGPPTLHRHGYAETFLFEEGEFEVSTVDEDFVPSAVTVGAGDTVSVPSMAWHNFKNVGDTRGRFIVVHNPPVMEAVIRDLGMPVQDPENPPSPEGPPSEEEMQRMMEVIGRYMEMLPPEKVREHTAELARHPFQDPRNGHDIEETG